MTFKNYFRLFLFRDPGKRGRIVADTLLPMMFLGLRKLGNICCGHKMFLNKITNIFCVLDTKFVSATNVARLGKRGNICVGNNVSATISVLVCQGLKEAFPRSNISRIFEDSLSCVGRFFQNCTSLKASVI